MNQHACYRLCCWLYASSRTVCFLTFSSSHGEATGGAEAAARKAMSDQRGAAEAKPGPGWVQPQLYTLCNIKSVTSQETSQLGVVFSWVVTTSSCDIAMSPIADQSGLRCVQTESRLNSHVACLIFGWMVCVYLPPNVNASSTGPQMASSRCTDTKSACECSTKQGCYGFYGLVRFIHTWKESRKAPLGGCISGAVLVGANRCQCPRNSESGPPCGPPKQGVCINNTMTDFLQWFCF